MRTHRLELLLIAALTHSAIATQDDVLVFTRTAGFRHQCIPVAVDLVSTLSRERCFTVTHTEDPAAFTPASLAGFRAVVFLYTSGDVLDDQQQTALESFVRQGGGFVGVHSAADTEPAWPFYGQLIGARFVNHPAIQPARILIEPPAASQLPHPATINLPSPWDRTDEWYNFDVNPRPNVRVLATVEESSYQGGTMGADHPIAWCHTIDLGRSIYTALGHTLESVHDPLFKSHLGGAISWALGHDVDAPCRADFNCDATVNPDDLADYLTIYFGPSPLPTADFNDDGAANPDDLADLITTFFAGC